MRTVDEAAASELGGATPRRWATGGRRFGSIFSPASWPDRFPPGCHVALVYRTRTGEPFPLWEGTAP